MPRLTKEQKEAQGRCSFPGCTRVWVSTFRGRLCALHNEPPAPPPAIPTTPPAKPWSDPERDEDA